MLETINKFEGNEVSEAKGNLIVLGATEEKSIKVDPVRELLSQLSLEKWDPNRRRYVLIPRAELLTTSASNALLKILEEPGPGTHFFLCAPSRRSLLNTIVSRCILWNFYGQVKKSKGAGASHFMEAFFKGNSEGLSKLSKPDFLLEFEGFKEEMKDSFFDKAFSGDLDRRYWFDLFAFLDRCETHLGSNMDRQWIVKAIEEFNHS